MNALKEGWFSELSPPDSSCGSWEGSAMSLEVEKVLFHKRSQYQDVLIFESKRHGKVLALDGIIQCTEFDEFAYHEMLAHLPLFAHPNPKTVLIIGGGDGGIAREVLKHSVEKVVLCEIDQLVIEASRLFLPSISCELNNQRLEIVVTDGIEYLKNNLGQFDVIITDSSDPIGPAEGLYDSTFYSLLKKALKPHGIVASQGECPWIDLKMISTLFSSCKQIFPQVRYAIMSVPTYTTGTIGCVICGLDTNDLTVPTRMNQTELDEMNLKFYNFDIHRSAFSLPNFIKKALE